MSTLRDKILAIHYPQSAGQVPPCGYVLGHRHALDSAAELVGEYEELVDALSKALDWVSGVGLDHIPNDVYHNRGGFEALERARTLLAAYRD